MDHADRAPDTIIPTARTLRRRLLNVRSHHPHRTTSDTPHARPVAMGDTVPHRARAPARRSPAHLSHGADRDNDRRRPSALACPNATARDATTASTGPTPTANHPHRHETSQTPPTMSHDRSDPPTQHRARTGGSRLSRSSVTPHRWRISGTRTGPGGACSSVDTLLCNRGLEQPRAAMRQLLPVVHCGSIAAGIGSSDRQASRQSGRASWLLLSAIRQARRAPWT